MKKIIKSRKERGKEMQAERERERERPTIGGAEETKERQ